MTLNRPDPAVSRSSRLIGGGGAMAGSALLISIFEPSWVTYALVVIGLAVLAVGTAMGRATSY